jgi:hypothetical protein
MIPLNLLCSRRTPVNEAATRIADFFNVSDDLGRLEPVTGGRERGVRVATIGVSAVWFRPPSGQPFQQKLNGRMTIGGIRSLIAEQLKVDDAKCLNFQWQNRERGRSEEIALLKEMRVIRFW